MITMTSSDVTSELDNVLKSEMETSTELPDVRPFVLQMDRNQKPEDVVSMLISADRQFVKEKTSMVRIELKGYEEEKRHPSVVVNAKKKYAKAIELGLLGFLLKHGYEDTAKATYCMAYCRARIGTTDGTKTIRFPHFSESDYTKVKLASIEAFNKILSDRRVTSHS